METKRDEDQGYSQNYHVTFNYKPVEANNIEEVVQKFNNNLAAKPIAASVSKLNIVSRTN